VQRRSWSTGDSRFIFTVLMAIGLASSARAEDPSTPDMDALAAPVDGSDDRDEGPPIGEPAVDAEPVVAPVVDGDGAPPAVEPVVPVVVPVAVAPAEPDRLGDLRRREPLRRERWPVPLLALTSGGTALVVAVGAPALAVLIAQIGWLPYEVTRPVSNALGFGPLVAPALAAGAMYFGGDDLDVKATAAAGYGGAFVLGGVGAVTVPIVLLAAARAGWLSAGELAPVDLLIVVVVGVVVGAGAGGLIGEIVGSAAGPVIAWGIRPVVEAE